MAEYIEREAFSEALETAIKLQELAVKMMDAEDDPELQMSLKVYSDILNGIKEFPAADVVERPKEIAKERLAEIIQAEIDGRLKMSKPPLMETCGSCKHFHPYPGMATGPCDCRVKLDRRRQPTSQVLYVSQSRVRCRDDYEPREGAT